MKRTFLLFLLVTPAVAGPYPGGGPYPQVPPGAPTAFLFNPSLTGGGVSSPSTPYPGANGATSAGITIAAAGNSGVLQYLWVVPDVTPVHGMLTNLDRLNLRVWVDTTTNNLGSGGGWTNKAIDLPLGLLLGSIDRKLITNQNYSVVANSAYIDRTDVSTNVLEAGPVTTLGIRLPMPFNNGIYAELWNTYSNNSWPYGYIYGYWNTNAAAVGLSSSYRLQSGYWNNLFPSNYNSGNLLYSLSQSNGFIAGVMESVCNLTNGGDAGQAYELNGMKYVTAPGVTNTFPGGDDSFLSTYTALTGPYMGYNYGITHYLQFSTLTQYAIEAYRWFNQDAITWNNSLSIYINNMSESRSVDRIDIGHLYYAPLRTIINQPLLIRTGTNTAGSGTVTIGAFNCIGGNYLEVDVGLKTSLARTISSVTVGGVALTNLYTTNYVSAAGGKLAIYGLANPPSGDIVVTLSGTYTVCNVNAKLFNNVGNATVLNAIQSGSSITTIGGAVTTLATDLVSDVVIYDSALETASVAGTGQTIVATEKPGAFGDIACSTVPGAASSTTSTWNFTAGDANISWIAVVLNGN